MSELFINLIYIVATVLFIFGLKMLSSPATARNGNLISALGMLLAIIAVLLTDPSLCSEGALAEATDEIISIPAGQDLLGRVIDTLGDAIDGYQDIARQELYLIESKAPGIMPRESVKEPLLTGIKGIDSMIPVGKKGILRGKIG